MRQVMAVVALAIVGAACTQAPTDPLDPAVDEQRRRAYATHEQRDADLSMVPGVRRLEVEATRDVCVHPESTTFGRPAAHRLECTLTSSQALALPDAAQAQALHQWAAAHKCMVLGSEDLRSWGTAYKAPVLPEITYTCGDSAALRFSASPPAELQAYPRSISRTGETVVAAQASEAGALARARAAREPIAVWVSITTDYWRK